MIRIAIVFLVSVAVAIANPLVFLSGSGGVGAAPSVPTYFGSTSNPADNGTVGAAQVTITPLASIQTGDLVILLAVSRAGTTGNWTIGVTGGQSWTSVEFGGNPNTITQLYWCTFNGTWSADPRVDSANTTSTSAIMHVFRPSNTSKIWAVDVALAFSTVTAPLTPFTVARAGITTTHTETVTLACWHTRDANTWDSLSGSGWIVTGLAQYRNIAGTDASSTFAHHLNAATSIVVPSVSKNQATLGGDDTLTAIISWYAS